MGWKASADAIRQRWNSNWAGTSYTHYDNAPFVDPDPAEPWARLTMQPADVAQRSLGAVGERRERVTGLIGVQLFVPLGSGGATALDLADDVRALFEGQVFGGLTCRTARGGPAARDTKGPWWMVELSIPFYTDETF